MVPLTPRFDVVAQLPALRGYARALTRDESLAEDLVHDTLVRAYEGHDSFRDDGDLKRWLFSILHNVFVSDVKRRVASQRRTERVAELADVTSAPAQEHRVRLAQLQAGFDAMPAEQRSVLHLVAVEGLAYHVAAETLCIPLGTLMSRLARARSALRNFENTAAPDQTGAPALRLIGGTHARP